MASSNHHPINNGNAKKSAAAAADTTNISSTSSLDALLTRRGRSLAAGEQLRLTLIKGPSHVTVVDPVNPKNNETFPLVAKFPESVVRPDFRTKWKTARLYQQDVPKVQDDSDDEQQQQGEKPRKKWRRRRKDAPKRQWILQENTEFLESMMMRKRQKLPSDTNHQNTNIDHPAAASAVSSRYEGTPEHNPSHYGILAVMASSSLQEKDDTTTTTMQEDNNDAMLQVSLLPTPHAVCTFSQPASHQTLSLTEAEHAIQDQRANVSRYMMHSSSNNKSSSLNNNASSKARLFSKLQSKQHNHEQDDEDDDVMADVMFQNRKGGSSSSSRKELLTSLAEDGTKVDRDGVLGGTNDLEFGGRRHFGRFAVDKSDNDTGEKKDKLSAAAGTEKASVGYDGMAMSEDFYQRDVKAEYEDLDYDANEQFDDDDVDLGETEVMVDPNAGFDVDEDDDEDGDELEEAGEGGAEGLATVAGFRALLAKARGETTPTDASDGEGEEEKAGGSRPSSPKAAEAAAAAEAEKNAPMDDSLAQVMAAAEKSVTAAKQKAAGSKRDGKAKGVELDENGERKITLESIQNEIWLHHGAIPTKRLMKIFNIKKKSSPERRDKFAKLVKELCIMKNDPVEGVFLVLKQHYSKMK